MAGILFLSNNALLIIHNYSRKVIVRSLHLLRTVRRPVRVTLKSDSRILNDEIVEEILMELLTVCKILSIKFYFIFVYKSKH